MIDWSLVSLNMFAKCPANGNPKTRLQPPLNRDQARQLHIHLADLTANTLRFASPFGFTLWLDQASAHPWVIKQQDLPATQINIQQGDDLGQRMSYTLMASPQSARYSVLVGSDCAVLTPEHIAQAVQALVDGHQATFIPTEDGGYALIALARHHVDLFRGIRWGDGTVMQDTRERLKALSWRWSELDTLWDVDTPDDLVRLQQMGALTSSFFTEK